MGYQTLDVDDVHGWRSSSASGRMDCGRLSMRPKLYSFLARVYLSLILIKCSVQHAFRPVNMKNTRVSCWISFDCAGCLNQNSCYKEKSKHKTPDLIQRGV